MKLNQIFGTSTSVIICLLAVLMLPVGCNTAGEPNIPVTSKVEKQKAKFMGFETETFVLVLTNTSGKEITLDVNFGTKTLKVTIPSGQSKSIGLPESMDSWKLEQGDELTLSMPNDKTKKIKIE
jgi:hypothetical protein